MYIYGKNPIGHKNKLYQKVCFDEMERKLIYASVVGRFYTIG
jgi:hypothetical protein